MKQMHIAAADLNLLKTFIVIWELRSLLIEMFGRAAPSP